MDVPPRAVKKMTNAQLSAARFHSHQKVKEQRDPTAGLFRTHDIPLGDVDSDTLFPSAGLKPVTVAANVICDASGTIVVKIGNSSASQPGVGFRIAGGDLTMEAGAGSGDATNNVLETLADAVPIGRESRVIVAAIPGSGQARAWVNGRIVLRGQSSSGNFGTGWL